jgi:hypothetical protein
MHKLLLPNEIKISEIKENKSLSPNNYKKLLIKNQNCKKVSYYLSDDKPYYKGMEPGSNSYVSNSSQIFLRNSCINNMQFSVDKTKYICLNPKYYSESTVFDGDVLFCTDANIGDCSLFISDKESIIFSSGIVRLNFKENKFKYYVMAFMHDDYFREQLNSKTPKGATIKHSGDLFLECFIPDAPQEWIFTLMESLIKNIAYSEYYSGKKLRSTEQLINEEIMSKNVDYSNPSIKELKYKKRLDSGIYSEKVFYWRENIKCYKNGYFNLDKYGFELKRGPNLAKRDLGRSIQTEEYHHGYNVLIYPSDISSSGYINKVSYLGAKNPIWFLGERDILFAAEGTVGKTFAICDNTMHFTTNFHGTIIRPKSTQISLSKSIYLALYLNFLRYKGILECMSVGANGGSFAVGYWNNILIPNVEEKFMDRLTEIYNKDVKLNPIKHDKKLLSNAGIYQLNSFIIKCKVLLNQICNDIKNNELQSQEYYTHMID